MEYEETGFVPASDGTKLFFGVRGSGPVVVLADGIGCAGFVWAYLQPVLAAEYRVVHCHYRGHGRSGTPGASGVGMDTLARDLVHVAQHLGTTEFVVLGHSMGTQVALEAYRHAPDRVRGLGLLCGSFGQITKTFHGTNILEQMLPRLLALTGERRGLARALWGRLPPKLAFHGARVLGEVDALALREEDFRHYWEHIGLMDPDVFLRTLSSAGAHSAEDLLERIAAPTLVVAAERDTFTPSSLAKTMSERIPGAEFMLLEGGSHAAPVEQPRKLADRVQRFLRTRAFGTHTETRGGTLVAPAT